MGDVALDRLQPCLALLAVEIIAECLEIDVDAIQVRLDHVESCLRHKAVRDIDVLDAVLVSQLRRVVRVFEKDGGLVVGVGDHGDALLLAGLDERLGCRLLPQVVDLVIKVARLRHLPVLAKGTAKVAAVRADREDITARHKVKEGLLLDGVNVDGYGLCVDDEVQYAVDIPAYTALARPTRLYGAKVLARLALHGIVGECFDKIGFLAHRTASSRCLSGNDRCAVILHVAHSC